ncbi:tyrosine-protein phosphatase [Rhizobium sp. L1K21]|uniref:tyrosine-protein phosphatase n=1 Tax=Rhizobium sp. L1K21 TaxID=2954933 RepID=UPI002093820B|nr:tyrosine-protein phosphatase [Rhizobium sp. L1K21]MCO6187604.1 tyrosine-protein phosphatase [Rhizobium sp. L1K21]
MERHIRIPGTYNIRDLGGYGIVGGGQTQWRRILRADSLHRIDTDGVAALIAEGVRTVIDLRHDRELAEAPGLFCNHPEISYHSISLFEDLAPEPQMASQNGGNMLLGLYIAALDKRGEAFRAILETIADAPPGAVLFHCTAGKDRTGLVAALVLAATGVCDNEIVADYAMTGPLIAPMLEELVAAASARGTDVESFRPLLTSDPQTMSAAISHISDAFGGIEAFFDRIALSQDRRQALAQRLANTETRWKEVV